MSWLAAAIGGAVAVGGAVYQNYENKKAAQEQREYNKKVQEEQNKYNLQRWEDANKYNSPIEQMGRFGQAGLNPHLIYGKGTHGNASTINSADVKPYTRAEARNVVDGVDVFGQHAQLKNLQAQTSNIEAQTIAKRIEAVGLKQKAIGEYMNNVSKKYRLPYDQTKALLEFEKFSSETQIKDHEAHSTGIDLQTKRDTHKAQIDKIIQEARNAKKTGDLRDLEIQLKQLQVETGINPNNGIWANIIARILMDAGWTRNDLKQLK